MSVKTASVEFVPLHVPFEVIASLVKSGRKNPRAFESKEEGIIVVISEDNGFKHLSITCNKKEPTLSRLRAIRQKFAPDMELALYINDATATALHLWEVKKEHTANILTSV